MSCCGALGIAGGKALDGRSRRGPVADAAGLMAAELGGPGEWVRGVCGG